MTTPSILPGLALGRAPLPGTAQGTGGEPGTSLATGEEFAALVAGLLAGLPTSPSGADAAGTEPAGGQDKDVPNDVPGTPGTDPAGGASGPPAGAPLERPSPLPSGPVVAPPVDDAPPHGSTPVPDGVNQGRLRPIGPRAPAPAAPHGTEAPDSRPGHGPAPAVATAGIATAGGAAATPVPVTVIASAVVPEATVLPRPTRGSARPDAPLRNDGTVDAPAPHASDVLSAKGSPPARGDAPARVDLAGPAWPQVRLDRPDGRAPGVRPADAGTQKVAPEPPAPTGVPFLVPRIPSDVATAREPGEAVTPGPPTGSSTPTAAAATPVPAVPSTSASPAPSPGPSPSATATQLLTPVLAVHRRGTDGTHVMTVEVTPEQLGPVRLEVELRQGRVELRLTGGTEAARDALIAALPELRKALDGAGVVTGSLQVAGFAADPGAAGSSGSDSSGAFTSSADPDGSDTARSHHLADGPDGSPPDRGASPGTDSTVRPTSGRSGLDLHL